MINQRSRSHHFQLTASKVTLIIPILTSRKAKDWKFKIIEFLLSMRCRNCTQHFCSNPSSESLAAWPLFIAREAEKCSHYLWPSHQTITTEEEGNRFWWLHSGPCHRQVYIIPLICLGEPCYIRNSLFSLTLGMFELNLVTLRVTHFHCLVCLFITLNRFLTSLLYF